MMQTKFRYMKIILTENVINSDKILLNSQKLQKSKSNLHLKKMKKVHVKIVENEEIRNIQKSIPKCSEICKSCTKHEKTYT